MEELNLIRKKVWSYINVYPELEFDELFSEACLAYIEVADRYDPAKGKKSTFIYRVVENRLNNLIKSEKKRNDNQININTFLERKYIPSPEQIIIDRLIWAELIAKLSPEAKMIYQLVKTNDLPTDKPRKIRGAVVKKLREIGWSHGLIWSSFREIKSALSI